MKDREIEKFKDVLGIEEEIKVPSMTPEKKMEKELEIDVISLKTTAFFKATPREKSATPKS